ncbi:phospholipid carrier-dependent glycosyltransferase [Amycolatopsis sp. DSM 110486]|uniref:phospholipid carrier-dependent glycosyltransferase n=1 Tax=Amycolatopsis sp. DSM 110486 TaxID=2865832 RepID=UPI001C6A4E9C|nr:phospholipid carrier-dependent glycosyltransferase [Amycolatopsis sp. DSM 110486]QYN19827.1 phospholipid carrier-dependent glycosyltransferase [Amycolatopsis sp. DSM 110486]
MAQQSWGITFPGRSPTPISRIRRDPVAAAGTRLLSLDLVLGLLALAGGLRVIYLAATTPALPGEATTVARAYALGHLTAYGGTTTAGASPFGQLQLAGYTMLSHAFDRAATPVAAVREAMIVATVVTTVLVWLLARRLGLPRWAGLVAAVLLAVSPLAIGLQHVVVVEHLAVMWALAGLCLVAAPLRPSHAAGDHSGPARHGLAQDLLGAGCLLAAVLTSPLTLLFLPAAGWLLLRRSPVRAGLVAVVVNLGLGLAFGPLSAWLRPALATGGEPALPRWLVFDPALTAVSALALIAGLFVATVRPLAVSGIFVAGLLAVPGLPATAVLALLLPLTPLGAAGVAHAVVSAHHEPEHRRAPARAGVAVGVVVLTAAFALSWTYGFTALRPGPASPDPAIEARTWLQANAEGSRVLVDDATWTTLAAGGWPTGLLVTTADANPPPDWAALTPRALAQSSTVDSPDAAAVFGSGAGQVTVARLGPPVLVPDENGEKTARAHAGAALTRSGRVNCVPETRAVLGRGDLDPRLISTLAAFASQQPVRVAAFPPVPGEDAAGQPRRQVLVTGADGAATRFYAGQRAVFRPASVLRTAGGVLVTYPPFAPPGLLTSFTAP